MQYFFKYLTIVLCSWILPWSAVFSHLNFFHLSTALAEPLIRTEHPIWYGLKVRLESKLHFRNSSDNRIPVQFPFPPQALPVGQNSAFEETVDPGSHLEISSINLHADWEPVENLRIHAKLDTIDRYDRNPSSTDNKIDLDEAWVRYGEKPASWQIPFEVSYYLQAGKFGKFEKQIDRHLESYGLVSTAFNRFEDTGVELGVDPYPWLYFRASLATGNPVFIRDPNALAGDNGLSSFESLSGNPESAKKTGIVVLYDSETEDFDLSKNPEFGLASGFRIGDDEQKRVANLMFWGYQRNLADTTNLHGTFYGGDLDILDAGGFGLGTSGNDKTEYGLNFWLYFDEFSLFLQAVDQDLAGLDRRGIEVELSYIVDLKPYFTFQSVEVIRSVAPVFRYSRLDPDYSGDPRYPAPSVGFDWNKFDYGLRFELPYGLRLDLEYADNQFEQYDISGSNNEFLATIRWWCELVN